MKTNAGSSFSAPALVLPFSRRVEQGHSPRFETLPVHESAETLAQLASAAADPATAFLAAWAALLWRLTDQTEFIIGCVGEGGSVRRMNVCLAEGWSFKDLIRHIEAARREAKSAETDAHNPEGFLLPVAFCELTAETIVPRVDVRFQFHVMFCVRNAGSAWRAELVYDAACLPAHSAERMGRSLSTLLASAAAEPSQPAYALPILCEQDWRHVVIDFNQTAGFYPADKCIHQLFEEQVDRTPDRIALRDRKCALTYRELNERTNRLAHFLRRHGATPNSPIGLFVDRSAEMIVGLLAILKAGACYLPLIPTDPQARLARQLADTSPAILLTSETLISRLPDCDAKIVLIDAKLDDEPAGNPTPVSTPDDLVYVLFTSGSTGVPKGVATRHRNVVNYTHFICRQLRLEQYPEGWHFATVSTLAADLGNTSIFGALTSGGCLHVIDYETAMTPRLFAAYVAEHPIDLLKIAPSHLAALLRDSEDGAILPKRMVIVGGEKLTWDLLRDIRKRSSCAVMNHCGPTETTIGCCTFIVNEDAFREWKPATVPLGRPIANDQVYILDRRLQPVPVGVPGELYMSGAGLSRGYYNRPDLTAERFLAHPFCSDPSGRLYKTGDLGRFLPDGTIEFLGRSDHQVKIRGFRVEPAELEATLKRHPGVEQAIVTTEENQSGERVLVAYVARSSVPSETVLHEFLQRQVPDYMLPARIVLLDNFPLNANGKIDLRALAELGRQAPIAQKAVREPRTPEEERVAAIWAEVLRLDRIGIDDNFFALGGHSLLATRIVARIRKAFNLDFPLSAFLSNPTVEAVAARLREFQRLTRNEDEDLASLLREVEGMSEEEAERLLTSDLGEKVKG